MKRILYGAKRFIPGRVRRYVKDCVIDYRVFSTLEWSLKNMRRNGFRPSTVVDVGAFHGTWTLDVLDIFPAASFLMIEAQEGHRPFLDAVTHRHPNVDHRIAVLGPECRDQVIFHEYPESPIGSSVLPAWKHQGAREIVTRMQTLDAVLLETEMPGAELLKIDVQGYELEVLKGAARTLNTVQAVLLEVSLIELYDGSPLLPDVVTFMRDRNFVAYDICTLMRRPLDNTLAQIDMIFVPATSFLLRSREWGAGTII